MMQLACYAVMRLTMQYVIFEISLTLVCRAKSTRAACGNSPNALFLLAVVNLSIVNCVQLFPTKPMIHRMRYFIETKAMHRTRTTSDPHPKFAPVLPEPAGLSSFQSSHELF
jgi:hypothetical protein